jgi:alginate O-acetyltransferase complex protein AlgI
MNVTHLTVFATTSVIILLSPLLRQWLSTRSILLIFSLGCMAAISLWTLLLLLAFSLLVFAGGKSIHRNKTPSLFYVLIGLCLLPLLLYKIFGSEASGFEPGTLAILKLIGISYFTFNGLSYLIDVRRGFMVPEEDFTHLLLFLCYFPCIPAGPLHRYRYLNSQFSNALQPRGENLSRGFRLVLWGLFKNLVLAERLKFIADTILDNPAEYQGGFVLLGGLAFFFQIYCDFSAYVDVGMGFSRMMGIEIAQNFSNRVYLSSSRSEFWNGWHKTVNAWFRDYVFFPLVKGRPSKLRIDLVLLVTFILIGLWHALSVKFLIWGLLNGLWILAETKVRKRFSFFGRMWRTVGVVYHLSLSSFMAVIFRTSDLSASLRALASPARESFERDNLLRAIALTIPLLLIADQVNRMLKTNTVDVAMSGLRGWQRWSFYFGLAILIMAFAQQAVEGHYYMRF